jgi:hypothetical protein
MKHRCTWVAAVAILLLAAPAQAAAMNDDEGTPVAPLTGESLLASELGNPGTSTISGTCNPFGTSTFTFTVTGLATGPYPGPFSESGTVVLGAFGVPGNPIAATSFESDFTIDSLAGDVTGHKSLVGFEATSLGLCGTAAFPTGGADSLHFEGTVSYAATITTPTGTGTDSGESFVNLQDSQIRGQIGFNGFAFAESYVSTAVPACVQDNDHQGDCDDDSQGED